MHEFEMIQKYCAPLTVAEKGALALSDDAAVISARAGMQAVYTKDIMIAGVHFFPNGDPYLLAQKLLAVNVSDLCAMGATPRGYLLGLALPKAVDEAWIASFSAGLKEAITCFGGVLWGGDTTSFKSASESLVLSLTAVGEVPEGKAIKRSGAMVGDDVYVTGTIGNAALGLKILENSSDVSTLNQNEQNFLVSRYHLPSPSIELAKVLSSIATACADVSDGLVADASHIAKASSVKLQIEVELVPVSRPAKQAMSGNIADIEMLITGGDDYELIFTSPPSKRNVIDEIVNTSKLNITRIGSVLKGESVEVLGSGKPLNLAKTGYKHF